MNKGVLEAIERLITIIYEPDQNGLVEAFSELVEEFMRFIQQMYEIGYTVDINEELLKVQNAFEQKDYIKLADILLYEVKPSFEEVEL